MAMASTRELLKLAARRLFASRGFDGVSVRDIVLAAGQRNSGSLHYYFGTKEDLARELVADGARLIDERRNMLLDEMENEGGAIRLRHLLEILVWPSTDLAASDPEQKIPASEDTYIRFITMMQMSHRQLFNDALEGKWASGYQRCLDHIRQKLSAIDPELLNQRLVFMSLYLRAVMSSREAALADGKPHHFWSAEFTMENLLDSLEGILEPAASPKTRNALQRHRQQLAANQKKPRKKETVSRISIEHTV